MKTIAIALMETASFLSRLLGRDKKIQWTAGISSLLYPYFFGNAVNPILYKVKA